MYHAHYSKADGEILGYYNDSVHLKIPTPSTALSDDQWQDCIDNPGHRRIDLATSKPVVYTPPAPTLDGLKSQAKASITTFASNTRAQVAGQADQYKLAGWNDKSRRAERVLNSAANDTDIAIMQAECDQRGKSENPDQLAAIQAEKSQTLAMAVAVIDGMESAVLVEVDKAATPELLADLLVSLEAQAQIELDALQSQ